ncbi:MAG TPA: hypothetical protein VN903_39760 [Polyangia bacterium]|jgi:hypothetical protein|nr:hypothetical protein [Polyangia bacterium]
MSAFTSEDELDWRRIDVAGIVTHAGIASVRETELEDCLRWLAAEKYDVARLDVAGGFREIRRQLGEMFSWSAQFGYQLDDGSEVPPNLDALRDGFGFAASPSERRVLSLGRMESLWNLDPNWAAGFLAIAAEYSRIQLAVGRRFLTVVALPEGSSLVGARFESLVIPYFGWDARVTETVAG